MDLNKKTMQRIMLLITFAVLLFWGLYNISAIGERAVQPAVPAGAAAASASASPLC